MIKLTMTEKGGEPKALSFDKDEVTIGRVSGNDIVLPKGNVSKRHSRITLKDGHVEIADLKSTNGTYVNGKKILDATVLVATDRVYVGDFLITIDGLGGEVVAPRRAPPPPPPPRAHGSSSAKLPTLDERTNTGDAGPPPDDDDDELGLAAKPPRAGRVPPPPPPPPRRPPTPIATKPLSDDDDDLGEIAPPSPAELAAADDSTNNIGLFERRKTADHATFEGDRPATGSRPAAVLPPEPLPAPPGQPFAAPAEPAAIATGADGLDGLLGDPSVVQIVIASDAAYADRGAGLTAVAGGLGDPNAVADALWRLANMASPPPSSDNPVVDVRLPDGSRLVAVFPPVSAGGVVGSIRRAPQTEQALVDLIPPGAKDLQTLLDAAVVGQRNVLVTGDAAALPALTTALAALVPSDRRVVSIGGALARGRAGWIELQPAGDPTAIVRVAGSFRAEHLVVGEVVGAEAAELVLSAARGQEGLVFALPARSIAEALLRVEALASPAFGGAGAAAPLVASTIDLVVQVVAGTDGAARVVEIAEPKVEGGHVGADTVASWKSDGPKLGSGKLQVTGVSARLAAALSTAGQSLPSSLTRR